MYGIIQNGQGFWKESTPQDGYDAFLKYEQAVTRAKSDGVTWNCPFTVQYAKLGKDGRVLVIDEFRF